MKKMTISMDFLGSQSQQLFFHLMRRVIGQWPQELWFIMFSCFYVTKTCSNQVTSSICLRLDKHHVTDGDATTVTWSSTSQNSWACDELQDFNYGGRTGDLSSVETIYWTDSKNLWSVWTYGPGLSVVSASGSRRVDVKNSPVKILFFFCEQRRRKLNYEATLPSMH